MTIEQSWGKTRLHHYLQYDYWDPVNAMCLLSGFDYQAGVDIKNRDYLNALRALDFEAFADGDQKIVKQCLIKMEYDFDCLWELWVSGHPSSAQYHPDYYINWACSKGFEIPWLSWFHTQRKTSQEVITTSDRRNSQLKAIQSTKLKLGYESHSIPYGGKSKIEQICHKEQPSLFSESSFGHAWKAGLKRNLFRVKDHMKYSKNK